MTRTGRWKWLGKASVGLAVGGVCVGAAAAQSPPAPVTTRAEAQHPQPPAVKEVTLSMDGTFRIAVVTRSGYYVGGARLTIGRSKSDASGHIALAAVPAGVPEPLHLVTTAVGPTTVVGIKPGVYPVLVQAGQKTSETTLVVKASPLSTGPIVQTQVLIPSPDNAANDQAGAGDGDQTSVPPAGFGLGDAAAIGVIGGIPGLAIANILTNNHKDPKPVTSP